MRYTLCIPNQTPRGPYTGTECRWEVEALAGENWHWEPQPDGSLLAKNNGTGEVVAEAVPCD